VQADTNEAEGEDGEREQKKAADLAAALGLPGRFGRWGDDGMMIYSRA
jgi:hypothetical protein